MEPAIHDLVRQLTDSERLLLPELEAELELEGAESIDDDELLLDPWFFRTEEEIAAIEDDPTAKVIEIRIGDYGARLYDGGPFAESAR